MKYKILDNVVSKTITVDRSGQGNFTTVQQAIDSVPSKNQLWVRIHVKAGVYNEKVLVPQDKQYIVVEGEGKDTTTITLEAGGDSGMQNTTFTVLADNFVARDITFQIFVASSCGSSILFNHIAWLVVIVAAIYSALADDCAIVCFFDAQENIPDPIVKAYPVVLFILFSDPAQSLSV
ncbi:probable pectinesterase 55 [Humulus lupulus]|uniref:probable pectinesterase 55 n=1 Tax=Humulus lupulus TaxID=3486 RepID=UPI002B40C0A6|nr:probable pectinesterase 55 [Humulus lupulus]